MTEKIKNIVITILLSAIVAGVCVLCIFRPADAFSKSERRELASFPKISAETVLNGQFMRDFETYSTERFPFRDAFRTVKAWFSTNVFKKLENNGVFVADGHISKIDATENPQMMDYAAEKFLYLYNSYLKDKNTNVYLSVVPDKNFIIAAKNGYPALDYEGFIKKIREKTGYMNYIDIYEREKQI